jgi:hypothetical protein
MRKTNVALLSAVLLAGCGGDPDELVSKPGVGNEATDVVPNGKGGGTWDTAQSAPLERIRQAGISYHGGPVMLGTINIYYIWYGNWSGNAATTILTDFMNNLGGSPYERINATYYNGAGTHVSGNLALAGQTTVSAYLGTSLSDAQIQQVVADQCGGLGGCDSNSIYFVLTSADVTASSGFCTQYCGWHDHATIGGNDVKYAFVGDPTRCPSACEQQTKGPNGTSGADGMASIIAHESEEAISDPDLNAWYDRQGEENADKCAWTFGTTHADPSNGALYNMTLGSRNYLIQRNWRADTQICALQ